jgi:hypothetical protein
VVTSPPQAAAVVARTNIRAKRREVVFIVDLVEREGTYDLDASRQ